MDENSVSDLSDLSITNGQIQEKEVTQSQSGFESSTDSQSKDNASKDKAMNSTASSYNTPSGGNIKTSNRNAVAWIAVLFALVSLAVSGYAWYANFVEGRLQTTQQDNRIDVLR
ncbi:MAG: hypothetical protein GKR96_07100 [Gammaproteobacteria bacterium]|nr:hypothetical protein [Gammaproteobacteria bacterium]